MRRRKTPKIASDVQAFRSAAERFIEESHRLFPHEASELGLVQFEHDLGRNDAAIHRQHIELMHSTLRTVEALPDCMFGGDDWLDRRGFLSMLRSGLLHHATMERWRNNPQIHCD